jgi:hypothetical protein
MTKVAALGTIGSSTAADLVAARIDVASIDQWPAHVDAMLRDRLLAVLPDREQRVSVEAITCAISGATSPGRGAVVRGIEAAVRTELSCRSLDDMQRSRAGTCPRSAREWHFAQPQRDCCW